MKKILSTITILIFLTWNVNAAPPTRAFTYVSNTTIDPAQNNTNENALYSYLQTGVDTYAAGSITGAAVSASASIPYVSLSLSNSIVNADISSSAAISASKIEAGKTLPSGAVYFMFSGSCPSGTTDVTATYSNKFIKINATQLTTSGVVLTGTTDATAITQANLPSYSLTVTGRSAGGDGTNFGTSATGGASESLSISSGGSGTGHTHTLSSATTLEPASVTAKLCQVN